MVTAYEPWEMGAEEGIQAKGLEISDVESTLLLQGPEVKSQHSCECVHVHTHAHMHEHTSNFLFKNTLVK